MIFVNFPQMAILIIVFFFVENFKIHKQKGEFVKIKIFTLVIILWFSLKNGNLGFRNAKPEICEIICASSIK